MGDYFDEHNCEPLGQNETPNDYLLLARLLLDTGIANAMNIDYNNLFGYQSNSDLPPATSKEWLNTQLSENLLSESSVKGLECPVCLKEFNNNNEKCILKLPCLHKFHLECIKRWLEQTSSCPCCRYELPTDDKNYEEYKRQRKREQERVKELETLHDSMYM